MQRRMREDKPAGFTKILLIQIRTDTPQPDKIYVLGGPFRRGAGDALRAYRGIPRYG